MVNHNLCTYDLPVLSKHGIQLFFSEILTKVLDEDVCVMLVVDKITQTLLTTNKLANKPIHTEGECGFGCVCGVLANELNTILSIGREEIAFLMRDY